jgi:hypothetical protein
MCHAPEHVVTAGFLAGAFSTLTLLSPTTLPYDRNGGTPSTSICDAAVPQLPQTIAIEPGLASTVQWTLEYSPTFRQQCRILEAATAVSATVRIAPRSPGATERALATLRRTPAGGIDALIEIRNTDSLAELLGHEFEHVIEQLDGVNLAALAARGEARRLASGSFETRRAVAAGLRVESEALDNSPDRLQRAARRIWRAIRLR